MGVCFYGLPGLDLLCMGKVAWQALVLFFRLFCYCPSIHPAPDLDISRYQNYLKTIGLCVKKVRKQDSTHADHFPHFTQSSMHLVAVVDWTHVESAIACSVSIEEIGPSGKNQNMLV